MRLRELTAATRADSAADARLMTRKRPSDRWTLLGTLLGLAVSLAACEDDPEPRLISLENDGIVCIEPIRGAPNVQVVFGRCLSRSCNVPQAAACSLRVTGDRIEVFSQFEFTKPPAGDHRDCDTECFRERSECGTLQIPPGAYRLAHGAAEADLTLPLSAPVALFGLDSECAFPQRPD